MNMRSRSFEVLDGESYALMADEQGRFVKIITGSDLEKLYGKAHAFTLSNRGSRAVVFAWDAEQNKHVYDTSMHQPLSEVKETVSV